MELGSGLGHLGHGLARLDTPRFRGRSVGFGVVGRQQLVYFWVSTGPSAAPSEDIKT